MNKLLHTVLMIAITLGLLCAVASADPFVSGRPSEVNSSYMNLFSTPFMHQIINIQRQIHQAITDKIEALKEGQSLTALWGLLLISLGYGVFHVLAPGHGKVIVSSYFLGNQARWRDGVWAGLLMAIGHTITAVGVVVALYLVLGLGQFKVLDDARYIELVGYGMIAIIGLWLLQRAIRNKPKCNVCGHGHHHHGHDHEAQDSGTDEAMNIKSKQAMSLFAAASLVPCTGSMIILLFTLANGVLWAGILAVIAIALGMWGTITAIGTVSIFLRHVVVGNEEDANTKHQWVSRALGITAALIVIATGGLLFAGTLYSLTG